jgi:hypothetical protein
MRIRIKEGLAAKILCGLLMHHAHVNIVVNVREVLAVYLLERRDFSPQSYTPAET